MLLYGQLMYVINKPNTKVNKKIQDFTIPATVDRITLIHLIVIFTNMFRLKRNCPVAETE